ncbi:MAG: MBL fold metallo-hydrolase [Bacteroidales bacterium]
MTHTLPPRPLLCALLLAFFGLIASAQSVQRGPYTLDAIADGVFHLQDGNDSNPPGLHLNPDGTQAGLNNCSDMYLVTGRDKALLIDLSNPVTWDSTAAESLRSLVYDRVGDREFLITVTHRHGDHLGMLPAFADDPRAKFWIPGEEFGHAGPFPADRTEYFPENASLDLGGGVVLSTVEVPGHTPHSTLFLLPGEDLIFSGDAIGSGSGVWLFNEESFYVYKESVGRLLAFLENPGCPVDRDHLTILGGHAWQKGERDKLGPEYIDDMRTLMDEMARGTAAREKTSTFLPFLNTSFTFGSATITWNDEAADRYASQNHDSSL